MFYIYLKLNILLSATILIDSMYVCLKVLYFFFKLVYKDGS